MDSKIKNLGEDSLKVISFYISNELSKEDEKIKIINRTEIPKLSRNDKCSCGSGKKYKHCCGALA